MYTQTLTLRTLTGIFTQDLNIEGGQILSPWTMSRLAYLGITVSAFTLPTAELKDQNTCHT